MDACDIKLVVLRNIFLFVKQKTAYEMRISDWSSDVCSSDLGERPVYWTGPSVGFDIGADASKTFALVYHLYDTESLFERFPQIEGKLYFVGGFTANYLQRDDIIIVPIKLGVGWRLGANEIGRAHV